MTTQKVGRYEIHEELGRGGMATVYLSYDPLMKRRVAIKLLSGAMMTDQEFISRFKREAEVIAKLEHPYIVPIYDYGEHNNQPFIVMRYMRGGTLNDLMKEKENLSLTQIGTAYERVGAVLDEAHAQGIVHRDIKPANVMLDEEKEAFLGDFGIVKMEDSNADLTGGAIVGTFAYISPEQAYGDEEISGKSDIYALGVMLYELLAGERPFRANSPPKLMMMHIMEPVPNIRDKRPDLPEGIADVIYKAMSKKPEDRYQTADELAKAIQAVNKRIPSRRARRKGKSSELFDALGDMED